MMIVSELSNDCLAIVGLLPNIGWGYILKYCDYDFQKLMQGSW